MVHMSLKEELKKEPTTAILIILNILVFLISEVMGGSQNISVMLDAGAAYTPYILEQREYYRIVTCMFLHFGIEHLANNMLVLFVLGGRLERTIGKIRFVLVYFLGGLAGNILSLAWELKTENFGVSAGASGAVFAVTGALIYVVIRHRGRIEDLSMKQIMIMAAFSLYFGFTSAGVDNAAHIGGILAGFLLTLLIYHPRNRQIEMDCGSL